MVVLAGLEIWEISTLFELSIVEEWDKENPCGVTIEVEAVKALKPAKGLLVGGGTEVELLELVKPWNVANGFDALDCTEEGTNATGGGSDEAAEERLP